MDSNEDEMYIEVESNSEEFKSHNCASADEELARLVST